jgi:uncharacterized protein
MKTLLLALALGLASFSSAAQTSYSDEISAWRKRADDGLRRDNGWLTLAGRYVMKEGANTIGTDASNDIVLPAGTAPAKVGVITVSKGVISLKLAGDLRGQRGGQSFSDTELGTGSDARDWVKLGRLQMHVIERQMNGERRFVLRLADNENPLRANFKGRVWFDTSEAYKLQARYVPHKDGHKISILNVLGEESDQSSPGYLAFTLGGKEHRLDVVADAGDKDLFIIMKDQTAGTETYGPARFMAVPAPADLRKAANVVVDFNKAYNPPCAFSAYTTCPLPPDQNKLAVRIEAGEKYRKVD